MSKLAAFITAVAGSELSAKEAAVLAATRPCGVILFHRNIYNPQQVRRLTDAIRTAIPSDDLMILVDQEGGRVQRLGPPHWRWLPPAKHYASVYTRNSGNAVLAAQLVARLMAQELRDVGINTNCTPVLDLPALGCHAIIGDRAFGETPAQVVALGGAVARGMMAGGVVPVVKHIPGHGRATMDSHVALPVVATSRAELTVTDFAPFANLAHLPVAMSAHVVFSAIDPKTPASISPIVTKEIIRGAIGFDGLLMSDDIAMHALSGTVEARARAVYAAGSDLVLLCSGGIAETEAVAGVAPTLSGRSLERFEKAVAVFRQQATGYDKVASERALAAICRLRPESV